MLQRILGIIGWVGTAIVGVALAVRVLGWVGAIAIDPQLDRYVVYAAWIGLACVILYTLGQWREIVDHFRRRQTRYGAVAGVGVLVALVVAVLVNYLGNRTNWRWDLTENQRNSLSEQSVRVLEELDAPVTFTVFDRQTEFDRFRARLDEYAYHSPQVSVEYIDPDTRPVVAREYDVQTYGTVIVDYMGRRERVTSDQEQDLTNALIKAVSGMERTVYFVEGHGEKSPTITERDGYSAVAEALGRDNYAVETLPLAQQPDVPDDATVVVVAGPTSDLLAEETDALRRYLARGGKLLVLVDPSIGAQAGAMPNLEELLREWSVELGENIVVDVSGATNDPTAAVALTYPAHPITERFATLTVYPVARSVQPIAGGTAGRMAQPVVETSVRSWAEANVASLTEGQEIALDPEAGDEPGPVVIAAAVSAPIEVPEPAADAPAAGDADAGTDADPGDDPGAPRPETRVAVFGDSDFAMNAYGGLPGNLNLFANTISWLAQQENLIAIRPTQDADRRVSMTAGQQRMVFLASVFIIPLAVFGAGIYAWWRRR